jgi:hypothetical protein
MDIERNPKADRVAARATGIGVGFIALMVAWLVGAQLFAHVWGQPSAAYVALAVAVLVGVGVGALAIRRFLHVAARETVSDQKGHDVTTPEAQQA